MDKRIIKLGLFLMLVAGIAALILSNLNQLTSPIITENQEQQAQERMQEIFPQADEFVTEWERPDEEIRELNLAMVDDQPAGVIYTVSLNGYDNKITLMTGIDMNSGEITGVRILDHSETPGLGANITEENFLSRFAGKDSEHQLEVVKEETAEEEEIQGITAATISSSAVTEGVNMASDHFNANY